MNFHQKLFGVPWYSNSAVVLAGYVMLMQWRWSRPWSWWFDTQCTCWL